ncbi:MAG: NifB/NifX family molybdenum-iron cluster-binding protein [Phycisphaerae bacterium]
MNIAIPVYNSFVSNVFDFAGRLLLVSYENGVELSRREIKLVNPISARARQLEDSGADVLLCGALSQSVAAMIEAAGIAIVPYITGDVEEVLSAYLRGELLRPPFEMPGCWMHRSRGCGCRERRRGKRRAGEKNNTASERKKL